MDIKVEGLKWGMKYIGWSCFGVLYLGALGGGALEQLLQLYIELWSLHCSWKSTHGSVDPAVARLHLSGLILRVLGVHFSELISFSSL
ncbi:hypothetical protein L1887_00628 [Cichorium endivia]|nr:hypothetical protein L1887_00628 [Cichorium endivia]